MRGEGREAEEDLQHKVVAEFAYGWTPASLPSASASAATGHGCSGTVGVPRQEAVNWINIIIIVMFRRYTTTIHDIGSIQL